MLLNKYGRQINVLKYALQIFMALPQQLREGLLAVSCSSIRLFACSFYLPDICTVHGARNILSRIRKVLRAYF
jgi:hypothetical protein